jgi:hypothetical protein
MTKIIDLNKALMNRTVVNDQLNIHNDKDALLFLKKVFNDLGLELLSVMKEKKGYTFRLCKVNDVEYDDKDDSVFKRDIIDQVKAIKIDVNVPVNVYTPLYYKMNDAPNWDFDFTYKGKNIPVKEFDVWIVIAVDFLSKI